MRPLELNSREIIHIESFSFTLEISEYGSVTTTKHPVNAKDTDLLLLDYPGRNKEAPSGADRKHDLVGRSMSIRMGFEASKGQARHSFNSLACGPGYSSQPLLQYHARHHAPCHDKGLSL